MKILHKELMMTGYISYQTFIEQTTDFYNGISEAILKKQRGQYTENECNQEIQKISEFHLRTNLPVRDCVCTPEAHQNFITAANRCTKLMRSINDTNDTNKVEKICDVYRRMIALEQKRLENPDRVKVEETQLYTHRTDGTVTITTERSYRHETDFPFEEYNQQYQLLTNELDQLDAFNFMASLGDDRESLNKITNLVDETFKLSQANAEQFDKISAEIKERMEEDKARGFS